MDYEKLLKQYRKKPLFDHTALPVALTCDRNAITKIIPQREPVLFVDALTGLDPDNGLIAGSRRIEREDPVFEGHFPGYPMYPGSFTLEMIGQLALCMYYFIENQKTAVEADASPVTARATRILGAYFLEPIPPGSSVTLLAKKIEYSGFLAVAIGQALVDGTVSCVSAGEVAIL